MLALAVFPLVSALAAAPVAGPPSATVTPFHTEVAPRIDPVFGGVPALRKAIDQFLALQTEMEDVRDEFSTAVHETLAQLSTQPAAKTGATCPAGAAPRYDRALSAGARYLVLGRRLAARFRDVRRGDELGDTLGLTPDYRGKAKRAAELYVSLLRDYREMHFAFYDQLGAEMRHVGCTLQQAPTAPLPPGGVVAPSGTDAVGPTDPGLAAAWELEAPPGPTAPTLAPEKSKPEPASAAAPGIWIDIDNTSCAQPSRLAIDGTTVGSVSGGKRLAVRTRAGPRELCVLPSSDKRACGDAGTLRRAYLYDGWTLTVRCQK